MMKTKKKKIPGYRARRWVVERTHSWLNRFRRLLIRWEKKAGNYYAMIHFACAWIAFRAAGLFGQALSPIYMRVKRIGNQWTQNYSYNSINWNTSPSFNRVLTVTSIGPFVGNVGGSGKPAPAFSGYIDYFFNTDSPLVPEDLMPSMSPPSITLQPVDQTAFNGSAAMFSVAAAGTAPLSYQQKNNGVNIPDATGASYITPAVSLSDTGTKFLNSQLLGTMMPEHM